MTIRKRIEALQAKAPQTKPNEKDVATLGALWKGLERNAAIDPVTYLKPPIHKLAAELLERMVSKTLTENDRAMLTDLPECDFPVLLLIQGTADPRTR
jgi:hypothetical protein